MPPVMPCTIYHNSLYMLGILLTLPKLAYPHGASSCPFVLDFVSCRSLAVNIAASQVAQYGTFCTYKSQWGISDTNEGEISTADVLAVLIFFLLDIRDDSILSKEIPDFCEKLCILRYCCLWLYLHCLFSRIYLCLHI